MSIDGPGELGPEDQGVAPKAPDFPEADNPDHSGHHWKCSEDAGRDGGPEIDILSKKKKRIVYSLNYFDLRKYC